jgi:hypothetical protein
MKHSFGYTVNNTFNHWGDIAAIPFFLMLSIYFYQLENKNPYEWVLMIFSMGGFIVDIIFTYFYVYR